MEYFKTYIITNFILLCISAIMTFIALKNYKQYKRMSICLLLIISFAIILSIDENLQLVTKDLNSIPATTVLAFLGYVLRPIVLVWFIMLSKGEPKGKWFYLFVTPILINLIIYCFAFIPATKEAVFNFHIGDDGLITFGGGPLRYSSHVVSALYLIYFLYVSVTKLKAKHIVNSHILFICSLLIILCVIVETFFDPNGEVHILNTAITVCAMFYYLFLYMESVRYDPLTGLYNRATYYEDAMKMDKTVTSIIQLDMDGLKYINDNYGHQEGDKALATIAQAISDACDKDMYPYRLSGDEFLIIVNYLPKEIVESKIEQIKSDLRKTKYSCSIGYAYRSNKNISMEELLKKSEQQMYKAKEEFYRNSKYERRKTPVDW